MSASRQDSAGTWAKRYYLAARGVIDATLRPYDIGSTQWYLLWHLVHDGPLAQRDLLARLQIEKPTLSGVVAALVRKGLVEQTVAADDQRRKLLSVTDAGRALWQQLPDPVAFILETAFESIPQEDLDTTVRVLSTGTARLNALIQKGNRS